MAEEHCRQEISKSLANLKSFSFFIVISLFIILSLSFSSASSYNIILNQVDNKLLVEHEISLDSEQTVYVQIPEDALSLSSSKNYSISDNLIAVKGKSIKLSYITYESLEKSKEGYYFVDNFRFKFPVDTAGIKLTLKEGYFTERDSIFPKPDSVETDGSQISISWGLSNVGAGDDMPVFVPIKAERNSFLAWFSWILILIVAGFAAYFIYDKILRKKTNSKTKEDIDSHLIESEKAVLKILRSADRGEMWQKEVQLKANFSKAKLSRVIRNLESRNLVEKIPFGNTNKIRLK